MLPMSQYVRGSNHLGAPTLPRILTVPPQVGLDLPVRGHSMSSRVSLVSFLAVLFWCREPVRWNSAPAGGAGGLGWDLTWLYLLCL
jgi:hypothetical protein